MRTFTINNTDFEYDESKLYLDFFVNQGGPNMVTIDWGMLLQKIEDGKIQLPDLEYDLTMWDRWIYDVPRKRQYRQMVKEGFHVLSGEYWFENVPDEEVEKCFQGLTNTGELARRFIETFLPDLAEKCKSDRHPAYNHYIEPER